MCNGNAGLMKLRLKVEAYFAPRSAPNFIQESKSLLYLYKCTGKLEPKLLTIDRRREKVHVSRSNASGFEIRLKMHRRICNKNALSVVTCDCSKKQFARR